MGENKALLPLRGVPIIERVVKRMCQAGNRIIITTNTPDQYAWLNVPLVADRLPGMGALGGLLTALSAAETELAAVVACDMPFASPRLFAHMAEEAVRLGCDVVVPANELGYEPLHALYRREVCLKWVEAALLRGERRMIGWFERVKVRVLTPDEVRAIEPFPYIFLNVNTPEDYQIAKALVKEENRFNLE